MFKTIHTYLPDEILVYLRRSRADDVSLSVEEVLAKHETILREWAEKNLDGPIPEENFYREVVSGETIDGRPEVQKVLQRMQSPKIKAILVVDVQRLSRGDLEDCGRLIKLLRYSHTHVITPIQIYDLEDEYDRDFFERELKRGNDYLEYFKKIQLRGTLLSVQSGNFVGSVPPYGYNKTYVLDGKRKCPTLEENPKEADIVRMMYEWHVNENIGDHTIAHRLNGMGIPTRSGKIWNKSSVRDILTNEHNIGLIRWNKRTHVKEVINMEIKTKIQISKEYDLYEGKHPAIVSKELFYKSQELRGSKPKIKSSNELVNPLASLVFCKCGRRLVYRQNKSTHSQPRLICEKHKYCDNGTVMYDDIFNDVCLELEKTIGNLQVEINSQDNNTISMNKHKIAILEKRILELENKEISLWETYSEKGMPEEIFNKLRDKLENDKKTTKDALLETQTNFPKKSYYEEKVILLSDVLKSLKNPAISAAVKNVFLKEVIDKIIVSKPKSFRLTDDTTLSDGMETKNGWVTMPYEIEISLKI